VIYEKTIAPAFTYNLDVKNWKGKMEKDGKDTREVTEKSDGSTGADTNLGHTERSGDFATGRPSRISETNVTTKLDGVRKWTTREMDHKSRREKLTTDGMQKRRRLDRNIE